MTHTRGFYAAAVAPSGRVRSLGIDAEPNEPLPAGVHPLISDDEERSRRLSLTARRPEVAWDRLLFCAKESIYKAWHPVVGEWLGFEDVTVRLSEDGRFTARLIGPARHRERAEFLAGLDGWWWRNGGHLVAAAIAPAGT
jgi:4'-phosphopantetheinyl transferase EntD